MRSRLGIVSTPTEIACSSSSWEESTGSQARAIRNACKLVVAWLPMRTLQHYLALLVVVALGLNVVMLAQNPAAPVAKPAPRPSSATEDSQLYRNSSFGFRYQVPYGWVDRTRDMKEGSEPGKSELLLAVFERPPEATGETINSAVVIAAESVASYPGLKTAEDYLAPLTELATSKGFKADGEPYPVQVGLRQLLRADFVKPMEIKTSEAKPGDDKLTMRQSSLVLLAKGQILSFTFIAGTEDELDDLMDGLHFGAAKPTTR
jgi:hypothetical protein